MQEGRLGKDMAFQCSFISHSFIHVIHICDPTELEALGNHTVDKALAPMGCSVQCKQLNDNNNK